MTVLNEPQTHKVRRPFNTRAERESYLANAPILTSRLLVRKLRESDAEQLNIMIAEHDHEYLRYLGWPTNVEYLQSWTVSACRNRGIFHFNRDVARRVGSIDFFLFRQGSQEIIGHISPYHDRIGNPKVAYFIRAQFRGQSYAREAVTAVQALMFKHERRPFHFAETVEPQSIRVLRKVGFRLIGKAMALTKNRNYIGKPLMRFRASLKDMRGIAQRPK